MRHLKSYKLFESSEIWSPEEILMELSIDLMDAGLKVNVYTGNYKHSNHPKFDGEVHLEINDTDKVFCKNYPEDDMDWLYGKPVITNFLKELEDFGLLRDRDYKVYAGGLGVNIIFDKKSTIRL